MKWAGISKRIAALLLIAAMVFMFTGCAGVVEEEDNASVSGQVQEAGEAARDEVPTETDTAEENEKNMILRIGETEVMVDWEDNESVEALKELAGGEPLTIELSMYGGFEQVGSIGQTLPRKDVQTTTSAGDIVLYSGNQIVLFYGSNSWSYTRLGRITDKNKSEMTDLLGNGDVTITLSIE